MAHPASEPQAEFNELNEIDNLLRLDYVKKLQNYKNTEQEEVLVSLLLLSKNLKNANLEIIFNSILPKKLLLSMLLQTGDSLEMNRLGMTIWTQFTHSIPLLEAVGSWKKLSYFIPHIVKLLPILAETEGTGDDYQHDLLLVHDCLDSFIRITSHFTQSTLPFSPFTDDTVATIASLDHPLSLVFSDEISRKLSDLGTPLQSSQIISLLGACSRILLRQDIYMFNAIFSAINLLSLSELNALALQNESEVILTFKLACRFLFASRMERDKQEAALVLVSILCNHLSVESGTSIIIPRKDTPKVHEMERIMLERARRSAVLGIEDSEDLDVEDIIEKLEQMQQSTPSGDDKTDNKRIISSKLLSQNQFLAIIVHLAGAEIQFMLDTTLKELSENERQSLPLLFSLLQDAVKVLVDEDACPDMDRSLDFIASVKTSLNDTFMATAAFLAERWDIFQEDGERQESLLDNILTLHCFGAYSAWIDVEPEVNVEEAERLVPLLVWLQKRGNFKSIQGSVFEMSFGLLSLVTSEESSLDLYLTLHGHMDLVKAFIATRNNIQKSISLASIVLNIIASQPTSKLVSLYSNLCPLFPTLEGIISRTHLYTTSYDEDEIELVGHAMVIYLFLFRAVPEKTITSLPLPLAPIFHFIDMRSQMMSDGLVDLWCLTISALSNCIAHVKINPQEASTFSSQLRTLQLLVQNSEEELELVQSLEVAFQNEFVV